MIKELLGIIFSNEQPKALKAVMSVEEDKKILSLINRRERQILVHSYIYYELDKNIISDATWTKWAFELTELRDRHPDIYEQSEYATTFRDFDGSTGFDLYSAYMRPEIINKGEYLVGVCDRNGWVGV